MAGKFDRASDYARVALAGIRPFNGVAALFVPATLARGLGVKPGEQPGSALRAPAVRGSHHPYRRPAVAAR